MGSPFCWRSTEPWKPLGSMSLCGILEIDRFPPNGGGACKERSPGITLEDYPPPQKKKTNMTGWKINHLSRCISCWKWGCSIVMVVFGGVNGWKLQPSPMKRKENDLNQASRELCSINKSSRVYFREIYHPWNSHFCSENDGLEYDCFLLGRHIFRGRLLVSGKSWLLNYYNLARLMEFMIFFDANGIHHDLHVVLMA